MTQAELNRLWVRDLISDRGLTAEIEAQALLILEFRKELQQL